MLRIIGIWATISKIPTLENTGFQYIIFLTQHFFYIFTLNISQKETPKPINHNIFWKKLRSFSYLIFFFLKLWMFWCH